MGLTRMGVGGDAAIPAMNRAVDSALACPVVVGREEEIGRLLDVLKLRPCLVLLEGEAGVGKTRLIRELIARPELAGVRMLTGRSHPVREPLLLGALVEALGSLHDIVGAATLSPLTGALRGLLPELGKWLPPAPRRVDDPSVERHLLYRGLRELLGHLGPTILVLEDLHWGDDATAEFLRFLTSQPPPDLGVVLTYRPEDMPRQSRLFGVVAQRSWELRFARVQLQPLSAEEVRTMVCAILATTEVSPEFATYLWQRTAGLPLAVEEVVRLVTDRKGIIRTGGRWFRLSLGELKVPASISDAVFERMRGLGDDAREIVAAAAVLDVAANEELLTRVAKLSVQRGNRALAEALAAAVLFEVDDDSYAFRHAVARQAAYDALTRPVRQRLHLRAAAALETWHPPPVARLAHHYRHSSRPLERCRFDEQAADLALAAGDNAGGVDYLIDALRVPVLDRTARARMAARLGRAAMHALSPLEDVIGCMTEVVDHGALSDAERGEVRFWLGRLLDLAGRGRTARQQWIQCIAELREHPGQMAHAMTLLGNPWTVETHVSEHLAWLERAVDAVADERCGGGIRSTVLLANREIRTQLGEPEMVGSDDRPAMLDPSSVQDQQDVIAYLWGRAGALLQLGHYVRARAMLDEVRRGADQLGYAAFGLLIETAEIVYACDTGQWDGLAERARRHAVDVAELPLWSVPALLISAHMSNASGDSGLAGEQFQSAMTTAVRTGAVLGIAAATAGLARLRLNEGDASAAMQLAVDGLDVIRRKGIWVWGRWLMAAATDAMIAAGQAADAEALVEEFGTGLSDRDAPALHAELAMCRALVAEATGRWREAVDEYAAAAQQYGGLPMPYEAAGAMLRGGLRLLDMDDGSGEAQVRSALATYERLGATVDAARARQALRRRHLVVPRPPARGRQSFGQSLSPREREIVELAAQGHTNNEIAAALFLSSWTVKRHLSAGMAKLNVRSRRGLASILSAGRREPVQG